MMRVLIITLLFSFAFSELTQTAYRQPAGYHKRWDYIRDALPEEKISFKKLFWEVSDPKHTNYGKFLTQKEIIDLVAPDLDSVLSVVSWVKEAGLDSDEIQIYPDFIQVSTNVQKASSLFSTQFSLYTSKFSGKSLIRINGGAHIPEEIRGHIDFVTGISELIDFDNNKKQVYSSEVHMTGADYGITPAILKEYYGIPSSINGSKVTSQGIAAFNDFFSLGALAQFDFVYNIKGVNVNRTGHNCLVGASPCDQMESDLDIQYITAIAPGVPTTFIGQDENAWILDWVQQVALMSNPPYVHSISYGWVELDQCEIASQCTKMGYDSAVYVNRTNAEFQKLGLMGITVLVSSGDDGAPSFYGSSGNCPYDVNHYCPIGGCYKGPTLCGGFSIYDSQNDLLCFFPMGLGTDDCRTLINNDYVWTHMQSWFLQKTPYQCNMGLILDNQLNYHFYSSCTCSEIYSSKYGQFTFSPYVFNSYNGDVFTAEYPTSSPYVTSVSATQFVWGNTMSVLKEIPASILNGSLITTGGGFSTFQPQPSYQKAAVDAYMTSGIDLPPSFSFDTSFRGYPDISLNGHHYIVYASTSNLDSCPCKGEYVDGTSASSPALAGMFSLINSLLLANGSTPLGFVNPALYDMAQVDPQAFYDVDQGNNNCNRAYCCTYGWEATHGWDPVTGLGTPVFSRFVDYFLKVKGQKN